MTRAFRARHADVPLILMGYANPIFAMTNERFSKLAAEVGADGLIVPDLPPEEGEELYGLCNERGVDSILLAAPSADLWDAQTDEEELGFPYDFIELWTTILERAESDGSEADKLKVALEKAAGCAVGEAAWTQFQEWGKKAVQIHKRNQHKLNSPVNL